MRLQGGRWYLSSWHNKNLPIGRKVNRKENITRTRVLTNVFSCAIMIMRHFYFFKGDIINYYN